MKEFVQGKDLNGRKDRAIQFSENGQAVTLSASGTGNVTVPDGAKKARIKVGYSETVLFGKATISGVPGGSFASADYDVISGEAEMRFVEAGETLYVYAVTDCTVKISFYL